MGTVLDSGMPPVGGACSSDMLAVVAHERVCVDWEEAGCVGVRFALEDSFFRCQEAGWRMRGIVDTEE